MRRSAKRVGGVAGLAAAIMFAGCTVGPRYRAPAPPTVTAYTPQPPPAETASSPGANGYAQHFNESAAIAADWWTAFQSPELNAMVAQALKNSPTLRWATGFGPDLPPRLALATFPYTETNYVSLLMRGGVPLLVVFVLLMLVVLRTARVAQRSAATDFQWCIATVVLVTTLGYFPLLLIESYLLDDGPPHAYWALVGLMLAAAGRRAGQPSRTVPVERPRWLAARR